MQQVIKTMVRVLKTVLRTMHPVLLGIKTMVEVDTVSLSLILVTLDIRMMVDLYLIVF